MSFKTNDVEQLSLFDSFSNLTAREQKALENSWAKVFAEQVFPKIDEKPFAVLYSDKASRPNTPVNVIIGACIIKELFDYSDDELVEGLMLDLRLQYALHTTSFTEQPLSDKTLSRFRRRCYDYEQTHGVDLYKAAIQNYNKEIAKMMMLDGKIRRMDSMMINSNMRMLARSELIYSCISRLVTYIHSVKPEMLPETLLHYAQPNDFNKVFYHERSSTLEERMEQFLKDAETYYLATVDGDQPRVRPFGTAHIFEGKLYIQTGKVKDVSKQLHANPKAEICAFKNGEWLRVAGELIPDDRSEARQSMLDAYPSLQEMYSADDGNTEVFYFKNATATFSSFTHEPEVEKF